MDARAIPSCHVVAVPYPGRGHLNAMLNLCRLLAARGVAITFIVTEEWLGLLGTPTPPLPECIRFDTIPNVIPSEHGRAADMVGFLEAVYTRMEAPFERLLDLLGLPAPVAILADVFVPWAVAVGNRRRMPVCMVSAVAATFFSAYYHFGRLPVASGCGGGSSRPPVVEVSDGIDHCLLENYIPGVKSIRLSDLEPLISNEMILNKVLEAFSCLRKAQCVIFTSFYELEANVVDSLRQELPYPVYPIGPCIPYMTLEEHQAKPKPENGTNLEEDCFTWLDSQPVNSVLYVSLGSFLSVSPSQLDEIAMGLAASQVKLLWVLRDKRSRVQELVGGSAGLVVPWCDQLKVLCHPSVGGFLTHCGMNSTLEAVFAGVPMLTLPITIDQPTNSRLIVDAWKIGYSLKEKMRTNGVIAKEEIAEAVKRLMLSDATESKDMRKRALLLKDSSRRATKEGGSSYSNISSFINYISQHNH